MSAESTPQGFEHRIRWQRLGDFEHFQYHVLAVDPGREITDFLIRYDAQQRIFLHRHRSITHTLVIRGEHRIYEPDGRFKEARPAGQYSIAPADAPPHSEGGGAEGAVVFYSTRGSAGGVLFDILDPRLEPVGQLTLADVAGLLEAQGAAPEA